MHDLSHVQGYPRRKQDTSFFPQDNAPCYTARAIKDGGPQDQDLVMATWPAQTPDLKDKVTSCQTKPSFLNFLPGVA